MKTGIELIAEERARQVSVEGWTPEHDDEHRQGEMADAAAFYAVFASGQSQNYTFAELKESVPCNHFWPWADEWFKPSLDRVRNLQKAGALIAAEIDRLQREKGAADER